MTRIIMLALTTLALATGGIVGSANTAQADVVDPPGGVPYSWHTAKPNNNPWGCKVYAGKAVARGKVYFAGDIACNKAVLGSLDVELYVQRGRTPLANPKIKSCAGPTSACGRPVSYTNPRGAQTWYLNVVGRVGSRDNIATPTRWKFTA